MTYPQFITFWQGFQLLSELSIPCQRSRYDSDRESLKTTILGRIADNHIIFHHESFFSFTPNPLKGAFTVWGSTDSSAIPLFQSPLQGI